MKRKSGDRPDAPQGFFQLRWESWKATSQMNANQHGRCLFHAIRIVPGWSNLPAITAGRIYYVSAAIQEPSPVAIDALKEMAEQLNP